uniref:Uncharacterized protein n=1 Tax=Schlesneria paludicola TaxID=360056 RepID=A0A7C4QRD4_9PLAN
MNCAAVGVGGAVAGGGAAVGHFVATPLSAATLSSSGYQEACSSSSATGLSSLKLRQLGELLEGFTIAEILVALMLLSAAQRQREEDAGGTLLLLAGLAFASRVGQGSIDLSGVDVCPGQTNAGSGGQFCAWA